MGWRGEEPQPGMCVSPQAQCSPWSGCGAVLMEMELLLPGASPLLGVVVLRMEGLLTSPRCCHRAFASPHHLLPIPSCSLLLPPGQS